MLVNKYPLKVGDDGWSGLFKLGQENIFRGAQDFEG